MLVLVPNIKLPLIIQLVFKATNISLQSFSLHLPVQKQLQPCKAFYTVTDCISKQEFEMASRFVTAVLSWLAYANVDCNVNPCITDVQMLLWFRSVDYGCKLKLVDLVVLVQH